MSGGGIVPEAAMHQPLCLIEAFRILDGARAILRAKS